MVNTNKRKRASRDSGSGSRANTPRRSGDRSRSGSKSSKSHGEEAATAAPVVPVKPELVRQRIQQFQMPGESPVSLPVCLCLSVSVCVHVFLSQYARLNAKQIRGTTNTKSQREREYSLSV